MYVQLVSTCFFSCSPVGRLVPNDLVTVLTELREVRADWYDIGLALNLKPGDLDAIKGPYKYPKECLRETIKAWLNTSPDPSWEAIVQALRSPIVSRDNLAEFLEQEFCAQEGSEPPAAGKKSLEKTILVHAIWYTSLKSDTNIYDSEALISRHALTH